MSQNIITGSTAATDLPQVRDKPSFASCHFYKMDSHVEDEIDFQEEGGNDADVPEKQDTQLSKQKEPSNPSK